MTVPGTFCYPNPAWKNTPGSTDFRKEILEVVKLADFIRYVSQQVSMRTAYRD